MSNTCIFYSKNQGLFFLIILMVLQMCVPSFSREKFMASYLQIIAIINCRRKKILWQPLINIFRSDIRQMPIEISKLQYETIMAGSTGTVTSFLKPKLNTLPGNPPPHSELRLFQATFLSDILITRDFVVS